jgi:F-type H+-transporting ATPase subunit b
MESTLRALGQLLLRAIPTFLVVLALSYYLKLFFFRPLEKIMRQRHDATAGARQRAAESVERAAARSADYDSAMLAARTEAYQSQADLYRQLEEKRSEALAVARARTQGSVAEAKASLAEDAESAKAQLARDAEGLSVSIASAILGRSAA